MKKNKTNKQMNVDEKQSFGLTYMYINLLC